MSSGNESLLVHTFGGIVHGETGLAFYDAPASCSRRGGGGYIRIARINMDGPSMIMHTVNAIGDTLDMQSATAIMQNLVNAKSITAEGANIVLTAVSNNALAPVPPEERGQLRARILKLCLLTMANHA